ncbi:Transposase [Cordylochernes scorpioides]|uniref:Transposase n=1 Tax=Cordylochernes scorpioides TaxID=51811 RepID=A0ABY6LDC9_9ARAC|nr:Transposase [Cordylochernes scorpioides]
MTEWHRVVFSDESRFCLSSDSRRVRVWRRRGERSNPAAIVERPTVRQRGIMVWGAIAYDSRSPLLRIQGTMTAQRYVDDVLRPVTLPYLQGVPNALYQQDNALPHTASISQQALQDVQMLPWPPYSPDLSPIEHVWDIIGRRLHALPQPRSEDELWQMDHGNFGKFLATIGAVKEPGCFCGGEIQDARHLLLECPIFRDFRENRFGRIGQLDEFVDKKEKYKIFNQFCKYIYNFLLNWKKEKES